MSDFEQALEGLKKKGLRRRMAELFLKEFAHFHKQRDDSTIHLPVYKNTEYETVELVFKKKKGKFELSWSATDWRGYDTGDSCYLSESLMETLYNMLKGVEIEFVVFNDKYIDYDETRKDTVCIPNIEDFQNLIEKTAEVRAHRDGRKLGDNGFKIVKALSNKEAIKLASRGK